MAQQPLDGSAQPGTGTICDKQELEKTGKEKKGWQNLGLFRDPKALSGASQHPLVSPMKGGRKRGEISVR